MCGCCAFKSAGLGSSTKKGCVRGALRRSRLYFALKCDSNFERRSDADCCKPHMRNMTDTREALHFSEMLVPPSANIRVSNKSMASAMVSSENRSHSDARK